MNSEFYFVIGVMSGTSLDGIDFSYVKFNKKKYSEFEILATSTVAYAAEWKGVLEQAITFSDEKLKQLDKDYGKLLGSKILQFIQNKNIKIIDFIASHGHTVLHQPDKGITLQVGDGQQIATITNCEVISDFRTQDVKLGGQGAPLVPIGDQLLFSEYDYCLNLGGFANVSYVKNKQRIAFDICPVNIVLNAYAQQLGFAYDDAGEIAATGTVDTVLLDALNGMSYYQKSPPKSLGLEWVQEHVFPLLTSVKKETPDILRTFVEHIAIQISKVIYKNDSVLVTGGGVFNAFLMKRIAFYAKNNIDIFSKKIINYKEALIFAFLGVLRVDNQVNCLSSVTGAKKDHSSGVIFLP